VEITQELVWSRLRELGPLQENLSAVPAPVLTRIFSMIEAYRRDDQMSGWKIFEECEHAITHGSGAADTMEDAQVLTAVRQVWRTCEDLLSLKHREKMFPYPFEPSRN